MRPRLNVVDEYIAAVENNDGDSTLTVESVGTNHVYFYSEVNTDRCLALIKQMRELDQKLRQEHLSRDLPDDFPLTPIWLHINSFGGDLFAALSVVDQLKQIKTPIYSLIEGKAASGATLIAMSCTRRYIQPSAYMLIHQLINLFVGTFQQQKDDMEMSEKMMEQLTDFYVEHSKLDRKELTEILLRDRWWNAEQCLERGFVDEIKA